MTSQHESTSWIPNLTIARKITIEVNGEREEPVRIELRANALVRDLCQAYIDTLKRSNEAKSKLDFNSFTFSQHGNPLSIWQSFNEDSTVVVTEMEELFDSDDDDE